MLNIFSCFSKCFNGINVYGICRLAFMIVNTPPPSAAPSLKVLIAKFTRNKANAAFSSH